MPVGSAGDQPAPGLPAKWMKTPKKTLSDGDRPRGGEKPSSPAKAEATPGLGAGDAVWAAGEISSTNWAEMG